MPLLTLLPIFGFAFSFHLRFKKAISVSLFFAITFILSTLFVFGSVNFLLPGAHLLFWSGLAFLFYHFRENREQLTNTLKSPPLIIYSVASVFAFFLFKDMSLFFWDEYSHWGPFIKNMYLTNRFQNSSDNWAHLYYPPGAATWNYFTMLFSSYQEGYLFFSYFLLLFSAALMMYENIPWERWYWLASVFVIQMVLFAIFGHWFTSIYVDHLIGAVFAGIILSFLINSFKVNELPFFFFPLMSLFVIKEAGLFFAFAAIGLYALLTIVNNQQTKESFFNKVKAEFPKLALCAGLLGSLLVVSKGWEYRQSLHGLTPGKQSITGIVSDMFTGERELAAKDLATVRKNFWKVFFSQQLHKEKISLNYNESSVNILPRFEKNFKITTFGYFFFFALLVIAAYLLTTEQQKRRQVASIGIYLMGIFCVYLGILYMSYLIAFGGNALRIPSYVRYLNIAILPLTLIAFSLYLPFFQDRKESESSRENQFLVRGHAIAVLTLVLITRPYVAPLYSQNIPPANKNIAMVTKQIASQVPAESRLLVVLPEINGSMFEQMIRYHLLPARSFVSSRNFLAKSSEEMQEIYGDYDHIWFPQLSKGIIRKNRQILQQTLDGKVFGLYKVEKATQSYRAIL